MTSSRSDVAKRVAFPKELPFDAPNYLLHLLAAISRYRDVELDRALAPINLTVARYRALNAIVIAERESGRRDGGRGCGWFSRCNCGGSRS